MPRKLLASLIVIALAVAVIGAATYAQYHDEETSQDNTFTAGTLDLQVYLAATDEWVDDEDPDIDEYINDLANNVKPGDTAQITIPVRNVGSVGGTTSLKMYGLEELAGDNPEPEGSPDEANLGSAIHVDAMTFDGSPAVKSRPVMSSSPTLRELASDATPGPVIFTGGTLAGTSDGRWVISLSIPASTGNEIMGDQAIVDVDFGLEQ